MYLYISSYDKEKKGIYICELENEKLTLKNYIPTDDFPSYIIKSDNYIYASLKDGQGGEGGGVSNYQIINDHLQFHSSFETHGRSYTHLCLSPNKDYLFTANYHAGATASFEVTNHTIGKKLSVIHHEGFGPDPLKRQTSPHVHYVGITPDQKYVYAVDLGSDKVALYTYENGILNPEHSLNIVAGNGPRHMIFSHDGKFAYIVNEIGNCIMVYQYHDSHFTLIQVIKCSPRHFTEFTCAAAIRMCDDGKHIMISNRGHNSIALYRVNQESGKISLLYMEHVGKEPRDFNIIGNYVVVASQEENKLQLFKFDENNEKLIFTGQELIIPAPVCIAY